MPLEIHRCSVQRVQAKFYLAWQWSSIERRGRPLPNRRASFEDRCLLRSEAPIVLRRALRHNAVPTYKPGHRGRKAMFETQHHGEPSLRSPAAALTIFLYMRGVAVVD